MDRRGWLWKKKSSDKTINEEKSVSASESVGSNLSSVANLGDQQDKCKVKNFVQIPMESYAHMSGLEGQVKNLEDQVKGLEEKLSAAYSDLNNKDNLVKQHAKVAEEAVSGWEKADAEVLSLRHQLESITLSKLAVDDRASHLDGALKECMRQIRNVKEESEQKLQDVILMKTKQWEKIKFELEAKIDKLDQGLLKAAGENAALLRSLQESSNDIMIIIEEKSQGEAEIELLKKNIQSYEKEVASLKYELHVVSKELDIRNEEKNIIMRSAEVANKKNIESVQKIAKLEEECQRLRGLVRKKFPGPAALAQMKLEVESSRKFISEPYLRKTSIKIDNQQELECLTNQLKALEEETKTLKEALATSNAELQASRNLYAKAVDRVKSLEAQIQVFGQERRSQKSNLVIHYGNSQSTIAKNPSTIYSISEDGLEDPESPVESSADTIPDASDFRRGRSLEKSDKHKKETILGLMDDFLEMEKMACLSDNANVAHGIISKVNDSSEREAIDKKPDDASKAGELLSKQWTGSGLLSKQGSFGVKLSIIEPETDSNRLPILKRLRSIISQIIDSETKGTNICKLFEDLQRAMCELRDFLPITSGCPLSMKSNPNDASNGHQSYIQDVGEFLKTNVTVTDDNKVDTDFGITTHQDVAAAVSLIHQCVLMLGRDAVHLQGTCYNGYKLDANYQDFSASLNQFIANKTSLAEFVLKLSHALVKSTEFHLNYLGCKGKRVDISNFNGIDVVVPNNLTNKICYDRDDCTPQLSSTSVVPKGGKVSSGSEFNCRSHTCSLEEFEHMESKKDDKAVKHSEYMQDLRKIMLELQEKEQLLTELNIQLASSQKSYSLAEIQLKCMTESYKALETHVEELEAENKILEEKIEELKNEIVDQKQCHHDALVRYKAIEEKKQWDKKRAVCASNSVADFGINTRKDTELAAAEKKLAECQETLSLLGRQLHALCPQIDITMSQPSKRLQMNDMLVKPSYGWSNSSGSCNSNDFEQAEACSVFSDTQGATEEFSLNNCGSTCLSDTEESLSLNSSIGSSHPTYMLTKIDSSSSIPTKGSIHIEN